MENENSNNKINIFQKYYLPKENETKKTKKIDYLDYSSFVSTSMKKIPKEDISVSMTTKFTKIFYNYIIPYLSLKDLISFKSCNKITNSFISKKAINICILSNSSKNFNSPKERLSIWNHYLNLDNYKIKLFEEDKIKFDVDMNNKNENKNNINDYNDLEKNKDKDKLYYNIAMELTEMIKNEKNDNILKNIYDEEKIKSIKKSIEFIRRDIDRTYYIDYFTKGNGKIELKRVLESMCTVKGNVGYCQGMNFIVGAMIYLLKSEIDSFYIFNCMLNSYELNTLFEYNTPDYNTRVYQLNFYVKKYIPQVFQHFKKNDLSFDLIYSGWLLTLFSNYYDIEQLDFPWTCFIIDKWKGLIKICLIIIYELKDKLLECNLEGITKLMKENNAKLNKDFSKAVDLYKNKFKVTNKQLRQLKTEYYADLVKKKLEDTKTELNKWEEDQKQPLIEYLNEKNKIENNVIKDIETYKILNEECVKKYLLTLKKNNELMNYIKSLKIRINELASIKYDYEELFEYYKNALEQLDKKYSDEKQRENLRNIIETEKNNLLEKYLKIKDEFIVKNQLLYKQCEAIEKIGKEIKKCEIDKNKRRQQMQDYIFLYEKKIDELIKELSDKLKLSEIFKRTNKF